MPSIVNQSIIDASKIIVSSNSLANNLSAQLGFLFNLIWNNKDQDNASPDKMWSALDVNAVKIRTLYNTMASIINTAVGSTVLPAEPVGTASGQWTLTANADGTITAVKNA